MPTTQPPLNLMLDSGAFSAWTRRTPIPVEDYLDFLLKHRGNYTTAVNLDAIPGVPGQKPSPELVDRSAQESAANYRALSDRGVPVMPVFHYGEDRRHLDRMIEDGCEYIGLGGVAKAMARQRKEWFDWVFSILCGKSGYPSVKTHAFGMTSVGMLQRYPFYSVDSVSWMLMSGYGNIIIPRWSHGVGYDYTRQPFQVVMSEGTDSSKDLPFGVKRGHNRATLGTAGKHFAQMGSQEQAYIRRWLEEHDLADLDMSGDYLCRRQACARFFRLAAAQAGPKPFHAVHRGFSRRRVGTTYGQDTPISDELIFIFGVNADPFSNGTLQKQGCFDRLLSYINFHDGCKLDLRHLKRTGVAINQAPTKRLALKA